MTWIAETISTHRAEILDAVADLLPDNSAGLPFTRDELVAQAGITL